MCTKEKDRGHRMTVESTEDQHFPVAQDQHMPIAPDDEHMPDDEGKATTLSDGHMP